MMWVGGWVGATSSAAASPALQPASTASVARAFHGPIYVFGPESSGTRFISRSIAKVLDPTADWDGELPPCHMTSGGGLQHVSLPFGQSCWDESYLAKWDADGSPPLEKDVDLCSRTPSSSRWFADVTATLKARPQARAVIIVRDPEFSLDSVEVEHCPERDRAVKEQVFARSLIRDALKEVPAQIVMINYENMFYFARYEWSRVFHHLGLDMDALPRHDEFVDGDQKCSLARMSHFRRGRYLSSPHAHAARRDRLLSRRQSAAAVQGGRPSAHRARRQHSERDQRDGASGKCRSCKRLASRRALMVAP